MKDLSVNEPGQRKSGAECRIDRASRRVVAIAGPVALVFSRTCKALGKDQQVEATKLVGGWNRRHAAAAAKALEKAARDIGKTGS